MQGQRERDCSHSREAAAHLQHDLCRLYICCATHNAHNLPERGGVSHLPNKKQVGGPPIDTSLILSMLTARATRLLLMFHTSHGGMNDPHAPCMLCR